MEKVQHQVWARSEEKINWTGLEETGVTVKWGIRRES